MLKTWLNSCLAQGNSEIKFGGRRSDLCCANSCPGCATLAPRTIILQRVSVAARSGGAASRQLLRPFWPCWSFRLAIPEVGVLGGRYPSPIRLSGVVACLRRGRCRRRPPHTPRWRRTRFVSVRVGGYPPPPRPTLEFAPVRRLAGAGPLAGWRPGGSPPLERSAMLIFYQHLINIKYSKDFLC